MVWKSQGSELRGSKKKNKGVEEPKGAEKEEEIVSTSLLKGESDVFFCNQHSRVAKARGRGSPEPEPIAGKGLRAHQLWDRGV